MGGTTLSDREATQCLYYTRFYLEGRTPREIAAEVGKSEQAVYQAFKRWGWDASNRTQVPDPPRPVVWDRGRKRTVHQIGDFATAGHRDREVVEINGLLREAYARAERHPAIRLTAVRSDEEVLSFAEAVTQRAPKVRGRDFWRSPRGERLIDWCVARCETTAEFRLRFPAVYSAARRHDVLERIALRRTHCYDVGRPGRFYVLSFTCVSTNRLLTKIGITNRTVRERYRYEGVDYLARLDVAYEDGSVPRQIERAVLLRLRGLEYDGPPAMLATGNTEVFDVPWEDVANVTKEVLPR